MQVEMMMTARANQFSVNMSAWIMNHFDTKVAVGGTPIIESAPMVNAVIVQGTLKITGDTMVVPFAGAYIAVIFLNLLGSLVFFWLNVPKMKRRSK